jgi:CRP-like cAMP-binding protein
MIERIRQDIQERLEQLLAEADRLRHALQELGGADGGSSSATPQRGTRTGGGRRASGRPATGRRSRSTQTPTTGAAAAGSRNSAGGTKSAVLATLASAEGKPMTAGEVASSTGLGRASVSTTLSKLARSGEVNKAERGYQLVAGADA